MKKMKKLASILLAAIMVLAMAVPGMAATMVLPDDLDGHTYVAYQIFKGEQAEGVANLGNIEWGDGVKEDTLLVALAAEKFGGEESPFSVGMTAKEVAEAMQTWEYDSANALKFAEIVSQHLSTMNTSLTAGTNNDLTAGYYLVVDTSDQDKGGGVKNLSLLQLTNDTTQELKMKTNVPSVDKKVKDEADDRDTESAEKGTADGWGETADHDLNETFQFRLTATVPKDVRLSEYEKYTVTFHDTMSDGVTFENIASVKVNGTPITEGYTLTATENQAGGSWTLTIDDIKSIPEIDLSGDIVIEVIYNAHLNDSAYVGTEGTNKNDVYLEYSNNPNVGGSGDTGTTPEDTVWVFTYEMPNTKYDATTEDEKKVLEGAGFALYKKVGEGDTTREYAKIEDGKIQGWVSTTVGADGKWTLPEGAGIVTSGEDGKFNIQGLDVGTYYLHEEVTPPGFNTVADTEVEISATHRETSGGATATLTLKVNGETSEKVDVDNKKGATLPETGGIGTTIFYVLGSILVLGAVILLVTKRRMSVEK